MRIYNIFLICALALIGLTTSSFATTKLHYPIGEIAFMEGEAFSHKKGHQKVLKQGDLIYLQNKIETKESSRVLIVFIDDTEISLGEDTELVIDEYIFDPYDAQENKGRFVFPKGDFLWTSGLIADKKDSDVQLLTPRGSIGIRGTTVWGGTVQKRYGVFLNTGLVNYAGAWGNVELKPGQGVFHQDRSKQTSLSEVAAWKTSTIDEALQTISFKTFSTQQLDQRKKEIKSMNGKKRHDYRAKMFPYKENPYRPRLKIENENFFSDEFEEMKNR